MLSFDTRVEMLNEFAKDLIIKNVEISTLEKKRFTFQIRA